MSTRGYVIILSPGTSAQQRCPPTGLHITILQNALFKLPLTFGVPPTPRSLPAPTSSLDFVPYSLSLPSLRDITTFFTHLRFGAHRVHLFAAVLCTSLGRPSMFSNLERPDALWSRPFRHPYHDVGASLTTFPVLVTICVVQSQRSAAIYPTTESQHLPFSTAIPVSAGTATSQTHVRPDS